ncbi:muts protein-like protein 2A [Tribonema minus]|uniref:Muts protein-like protein 2A n=1 Tax=Tribonema minus TaxID=303371 RepID=A0A835YUY7_9STRA|nr:muts protein-like protein 2A [Tribonema minus]
MPEELETCSVAIKLGVKAQQRTVGLCARIPSPRDSEDDTVYWRLVSYEFLDNEQFSNLDSLLLQLGPAEAFVAAEPGSKEGKPKGDLAKLVNMLERRQIEFTNELERPLATACIAALLKELELEKAEDGSYRVVQGSLEQYVKLDSAAADAVTLLPDPAFPGANASIYAVLNRCKTKMGSRLLERWLRQPLRDRAAIEARQDLVAVFMGSAALRSALQDGPLRKSPDMEALQARLRHRRAGLTEVFKVYLFARCIPTFTDVLRDSSSGISDEEATLLEEKFAGKFHSLSHRFERFQELVENVLDLERLPDLSINPTYSPELAELKELMDEVKAEVDEIYLDARDGWCDFDKDKCLLEPDKQRGFVLRLTKANLEKDLKNRNSRAETISVLKNGVHFTTPQLRDAGKRYIALKQEYEKQQEELVGKAVETAATYLPLMESACNVVAELDVLVALAHTAAMAPEQYVRPKLLDAGSGVLDVQGARHPCLEWQEDMSFMPNSYAMKRDKGRFLVVTGPNMGGKSTYIRTLGSIVVMAQMGSFVPAASAEISIVDALFARVGAGDAQQRGVSTFMAEMLEASAILDAATDKSLIIIDELGRGTSTFDGFGLAWAISEYLVQEVKAFTLFATHFHEMTTLADTEPCVENWHVSAEVGSDKITMLYQVQPGPCLQSFGIHVAAMAGFPSSVIREAKRKAAALESFETAMEAMQTGDANFKSGTAQHDNKRLRKLGELFCALPVGTLGAAETIAAVRELVDKVYIGNGAAAAQ